MAPQYDETERRLPRGEREVTIRSMRREDIPAVRAYDVEMTARLDERNSQVAPGKESCAGGPWSEDEWLAEHFEKYAERGYITLLAEDGDGKVVGFADLWGADEPEPFGQSLNVECIDFFHEYYTLGLEVVLLQEAEKVAQAAGLPALDIGTNTASGDYPVLRRFGLKVFYEYDNVLCRCAAPRRARPERRTLSVSSLDLDGLIKVDHWSPTDFTHEADVERTWIAELTWPQHRAILELLGPEVDNYAQPIPPNPPAKSVLYADPKALASSDAMTDILAECASLSGELGAEELQFPCPSDIDLDEDRVHVVEREFAFAWMRKRL